MGKESSQEGSEAMDWEQIFQEYETYERLPWRDEGHQRIQRLFSRVGGALPRTSSPAWQPLSAMLEDPQKKWFVAALFAHVKQVPPQLVAPMARAAVYERNPSLNRRFIDPCLQANRYREVYQALLGYLERGSNFEKAGASNALYWVWAGSKEAHEAATDLHQRQRVLLLREFLANEALDLRRSLITRLPLDPTLYPEELRPSLEAVLEIARSHPDEYIRHRVTVKEGGVRTFPALPHRREDI